MKISVFHLLLLRMLFLFCLHSFAAVHGMDDADKQQSIYKINHRSEAMKSDLKHNNERSKKHFLTTNFSRADLPCPDSAAITPCTCTLDFDSRAYVDCTFVESIDQLVAVFQQDFPVKELYEFSMTNNSAINLMPSFMNGITFETVNLAPGPFILEDIDDNFLLDLKDTLKILYIFDSKLTTDFFPFSVLSSMNQLEDIRISASNINSIPPIRAPKLTSFYLIISSVESLASDLLTLFLNLGYNELTNVDEAVFGSMMPFVTLLELIANPLTCGCDIAWLILNPDFLARVDDDATCADGTNLHEIDPQQFIDLC